MIKYFSILLIIASLIVLSEVAYSGVETAVLDSLINEALQNNPELKAAEDQYESALKGKKAEGWLPDPNISVALSNVPSSSWALDETPMSGIALGITQMIPWPGELANRKSIAGLSAAIKKQYRSAVENKVVREVKSAYFDYSYWALAINILDDNIILMEALVDVAQTKYANGEGLAQDVLKAQTELSRMYDRRLEFEKMRKLSLAQLNRLLDTSPVILHDLRAELPEVSDSTFDFDIISEKASKTNPSLKISQTGIKMAEKQKSLAKNNYWPDLALGLEYRIRDVVPMDPVRGEDFVSVKAGLSIPLWFWRNQNNRVGAAQSQLNAATNSYQAAERQLEYSLTETAWELNRLREGYGLYDQTIIYQAESALESANIAYQVGKVDFLNLLMAQQRLFELEIEKLKLKKDYNKKLAVLEELVGERNAR